MKGSAVQVVARYSRALHRAATHQQCVDDVQRDLDQLCELLQELPPLNILFSVPVASRRQLRSVLQTLCSQMTLHVMTQRFLATLIDNRRLMLLRAIAAGFAQLQKQHLGVVPATVVSAIPLTQPEQNAITKSIAKGKTLDLTCKVDPEILGGLIVSVGNVIIDRSIRSRLLALERNMLTASSASAQ